MSDSLFLLSAGASLCLQFLAAFGALAVPRLLPRPVRVCAAGPAATAIHGEEETNPKP